MLFNLFNLLTSESSSTSTSVSDPATNNGGNYITWIIMGAALVLIIVMMVLSRRSQKKKQDELKATLDSIQPGNKVKTIGGICGVVVEVCKEDNTFILETGSEESGKSYIKFDKQAVYQTDAKAPTQAPVEEKKEEIFDETAAEEVTEETPVAETAESPVEETPATETTEEKAE